MSLLVLILNVNILVAQSTHEVKTIIYHGIHPDEPGGRCGLRNPERGLRLEVIVGHQPGDKIWRTGNHLKGKTTDGYSDDWFLMNARRFEVQGVTLLQAYCYLTDYIDQPLPQQKPDALQQSLDRCRKAGLKVLLRFAYERDMNREKGPGIETILTHLDQLAPVIQQNKDVIYVLQAGFVGSWGEWHSSTQYIEENHAALARIIAKELELLPNDRMIQLRVMPKYRRWVLEDSLLNRTTALDSANAFSQTPVARLGFADDGFLADENDGGTWPEPPFYANPGNPEFDRVTMESPYIAVDGELFWADQGGKIDGIQAAVRMRLHHYTSFSLVHSYSEFENKQFSIDKWMETPLTEEQVHQEKLPVSDGYFTDYAGNPVKRTEFEYIRDHLGYRIELQNARFPRFIEEGSNLNVEVELINRGFAVPVNPRPVYLALINAAGELVGKQKTDANPQNWQPFRPGDPEYKPLVHRVAGKISLENLEKGEYILGLWMPDADETLNQDSRYSLRCANGDVPWWTTADGRYGINILGTVTVSKK